MRKIFNISHNDEILLFFPLSRFASLVLVLILSFISCGRVWNQKGAALEEGIIVPETSEIVSLASPQLIPEGSQWDFVLGEKNVPHISFFDYSQGKLRYATLDNEGKWVIEEVDPPEGVAQFIAGKSPNIFLIDGRPHIVYLSTSRNQRIPKFNLVKEAFMDSLGIWRCRVVKKWEGGGEINFIRAGYVPSKKKIDVLIYDPDEYGILGGEFSPIDENSAKVCENAPEDENSDISLSYIYYLAQDFPTRNFIRLRFKLDPTCNRIVGSKLSPGFSVSFIPEFRRNFNNFGGFAIYDPVINQMFWIEFKNSDVNYSSPGTFSESITLYDNDTIGINYYLREEGGTSCFLTSANGFMIRLKYPASSVISVLFRSKEEGEGFQPAKFYVSSPFDIFVLRDDKMNYPYELSITYRKLFSYDIVPLGQNKAFPYAYADAKGTVHFTYFANIPPDFAVEYGVIRKDENGNYEKVFSTIDGGGGGIYTQGTGGSAVAATKEGVPIVAYFSPSAGDLRVAIPLENTWLSVAKLTQYISGLQPKVQLTKNESSLAILVPIRGDKNFSLNLIFVPFTL